VAVSVCPVSFSAVSLDYVCPELVLVKQLAISMLLASASTTTELLRWHS
jgi:hypothetical protein